ncbi:MAG: hypothetical protein JST31_09515, partial [Actinobacteria bacterium]|nr:hypothetical protein [Actinomycetota bacterium]
MGVDEAIGTGPPVASEWLEGEQLASIAELRGFEFTSRQLELWRYRGLLPRPARRHTDSRWNYPPGTAAQLLRLLELRRAVRSLELIRIVLWLEGYPLETGPVRRALAESLGELAAMLEQSDTGEGDEITALAGRLAAMRGRALVPRGPRMSRIERTRAYGYLLALIFGDAEQLASRAADAELLEKMLGATGAPSLAAVLAPPAPAAGPPPLPRPSELAALAVAASEAELETARRVLRAMAGWWPTLVALVGERRADGAPLAELAREQLQLL